MKINLWPPLFSGRLPTFQQTHRKIQEQLHHQIRSWLFSLSVSLFHSLRTVGILITLGESKRGEERMLCRFLTRACVVTLAPKRRPGVAQLGNLGTPFGTFARIRVFMHSWFSIQFERSSASPLFFGTCVDVHCCVRWGLIHGSRVWALASWHCCVCHLAKYVCVDPHCYSVLSP